MIKTKADLAFYLKEDANVNINRESCSWFRMKLCLWYGYEHYMAYNYLCALRRFEYRLNNKKGKFDLLYVLAKIKYRRLGVKYGFRINPNVVGYGFKIRHISCGGGIVGAKKMGNYCSVNGGVVIGIKQNQDDRATFGDNCTLNVGCKVIGKINIGNNVTIAPNSVVVKDVPDNAIVSGIPAKIIKMKE